MRNSPAIQIRLFQGGAKELTAIREIFFLSSSRQNFATPAAQSDFFALWTGYYLNHCLSHLLVADQGHRVIAYLTGCKESAAAIDFFKDRLRSYVLFNDLFPLFPAHFHVNVSPEFRGQGIGNKLIEYFIGQMKQEAIPGVHLVTSPMARNVSFYQRMGFSHSVTRSFETKPLLFLGKFI